MTRSEPSTGAARRPNRKASERPSEGLEAAVQAAASIDTIELSVRRPPHGFGSFLREAFGRRIEVKEIRDRTDHFRGMRVPVNRPTRADAEVAARILSDKRLGALISRVDIAVDFRAESDGEAADLIDWLDRHLVLKWRPAKSQKVRVGETTYWTDKRRARNLVTYRKSDRIVRLELRFQNARSVRGAGLDEPEKLTTASPSELIAHNVKAERMTERRIRKVTRDVYQAELKRHRRRKSRSHHAVADQYRSRIPNRVRSILGRADAQSIKRGSGMETVGTDWLGIPDHVTWSDDAGIELKTKS